MSTWLDYLKRGLSRQLPEDGLADNGAASTAGANLKNLHPFLTRHWRKGMLGTVLILLGVLLGLPQPLINRYLIDDVILGQQLHLLLTFVLLQAGVMLAARIVSMLEGFYFARFEQVIILDIQQDLLNRALRFPKSFFDGKEVGYLMSRLSSDVQGLRWFFSSTLVYALSHTLRLLGGLGLLFYLEWRLALIVLLTLPPLALGTGYFSRKVRVLSRQSMEKHANVSRRMQESLSATTLIKSFGSEKREVKRVVGELQAAQQIALEQTAVNSVANLVVNALPDVTRMVVVVAGAYLIVKGNWSLGSLLAFQSYLGYVHTPARYLASIGLQIQQALAALERVSALYDIVPEEETDSGIEVTQLNGTVEFRGVTFAYDAAQPVLQDISFSVPSGGHVALVGPSGVGKTTLVSLLLRFYQPTAGEIRFDGRPATDYKLHSLRQRIGYVSQSTLLLSGTIDANLRYGNPDAGDAQVIQAAKVAGIHDYIAGLPDGYQAVVGERGVNLSEGQKQRLAIARALIRNPDILVMDEPTSALDSVTEKSIFDALPRLIQNKTLFIVAHRLKTVQNADQILVLNEQRLVAVGTHRELMENNDYYRSLVTNQQVIAPESAAAI